MRESSDGQAKWTVERPHPWKAQVFEISDHNDDLVLVDDLSVWLALIPKTGEAGVRVTLRHGELFVEALDA